MTQVSPLTSRCGAPHARRPYHPSVVASAVLALISASMGSCESGPGPKPKQVTSAVREVPAPLRGTIGAEADFRGIQPTLVSGLGLVVGLNATGGQPLPDRIAASMEREMGLRGIGRSNESGGPAIAGKSPKEILRDPNVAVVEVIAAVPPGAPDGYEFDVFVRALNASSLEGGLLWRTELRLGPARPFGGAQAKPIASGSGPIFINPFADLGRESAGVTLDRGRVLAGGRVTNGLSIDLALDNPSHQRAAAVVSAINSRFPQGPGDRLDAARGRATSSQAAGPGITLTIPERFTQDPGDFIQLVRHLNVDDSAPEARARAFADAVRKEPALAEDIAWCLEAIGPRALPFCRELYDQPDPLPRLAGLRAGARLGDNASTPYLKELASSARGVERLEAIGLLARIDGGPSVDVTLQQLLGEKELTVRVAAYEALVARAERDRVAMIEARRRADLLSPIAGLSMEHVRVLASSAIPPGMMQGVERELVAGKFLLDVVPFGEPLVYLAQQGKPRIVLFGEDPTLRGPLLASAWDNRLLVASDAPQVPVRVLYRPLRAGSETAAQLPASLREVVAFLARKPTPEDPRPGLDLSYAEVVGALHAIHSQSPAPAFAFATQTDRLKGLIAEAAIALGTVDRPETPEDAERIVEFRKAPLDSPAPAASDRPTVVPLPASRPK